jgi:hypothetical protein
MDSGPEYSKAKLLICVIDEGDSNDTANNRSQLAKRYAGRHGTPVEA